MTKSHVGHEHPDQGVAHEHHDRQARPFYARGIAVLLAFVLFAIVYAVLFSVHAGAAKVQYDAMNQKSLAIREFGMADAPTVMGYFTTYGIPGGIVLFGIFTLIISYIVFGLARIAKWDGAAGLGILVAYGLFAFYGYEFAYKGPGTITWANGITSFVGFPLLWAAIVVAIVGILFIVLSVLHVGAKGGTA